MQQWRTVASPILTALMDGEDRLIAASEEPALVVLARCDQLDAAVRHAQAWLAVHPCPDPRFDAYVNELVSASRGMWAIMEMVAREAPEGQWIGNRAVADKVAPNLVDRIEQATRARTYLRQWDDQEGNERPERGSRQVNRFGLP